MTASGDNPTDERSSGAALQRVAGSPLPEVSGADSSLIIGRPELIDAWRALLLSLPQGAPTVRQLVLVDRDFADFPLDEAAVLQALTAWLRRPGRTLRLLGVDFEATARKLPRFARWRRDWVHRLDCLAPVQPPQRPWPCLMVCDGRVIERLDEGVWRARVHTDVHRATALVDALTQQSEASWPLHSLGL